MTDTATTHANSEEPSDPPKVLGVPIARWAVISISAIVVCYTAGSYSIKIYSDWMKVHKGDSAYSNAITAEMDAHEKSKSNDPGQQVVLFSGQDGPTLATSFSDGCVALSRPGPKLAYLAQGQSHVEWSLAPSRRPDTAPPDKPIALWRPGILSIPPLLKHMKFLVTSARYINLDDRDRELFHESAVIKSSVFGAVDDTHLQPVQGSCVNPHAGPFNSWWGPANGCWAPFWRQWRDGCIHYQMYNTCSGQWELGVHWTFCAAQHFY